MANGYIKIAHLYKRMPVLTDTNGDHLISVSDLRTAIATAAAETGDVVAVIRCKDCRLRDTEGCPFMAWDCGELTGETNDTDFFSHGERKEQA